MTDNPLISTNELADWKIKPGLSLIDCRFDLSRPEWAKESYMQSHIPGAIFCDLNHDLSSQPTTSSGRHPLPDPETFVQQLSQWGIQPGITVVVYDTTGGGFASRLWWMLRAVGHTNVHLLDGGFAKWQREKRPEESGWTVVQPTGYRYPAHFKPELSANVQTVVNALNDPTISLLDARASERFQGLQEPIDPVAGHIPGAKNRFHGLNLTADGVFKPADDLRKEFLALLGGTLPENAIVYCGSGVTSCHHLIAMELAGLTGARLYLGSWSEWIRDPSHPIATGK
jgi:thiosulfate/3-mercaptopyruvate sulfurtransferase